MKERKNIILLFSKLPEPKMVKTRLTTLKDGMFDPETASTLYCCMFFDVVEICMAAISKLNSRNKSQDMHYTGSCENPCESFQNDHKIDHKIKDTYEIVISTAPAENLPKMKKLFKDAGSWPMPITFIADSGKSFDEHYNDAFDQTWQMGADCILSMGCDMPALTENDIMFGFDTLHSFNDESGVVLAPDQEMGVSVIGWTKNTPFDHNGVFYNQEGLTVLPAYIRKAAAQNIPVKYLPPIPDVDTMSDLAHNITLVEALNYCSKFDNTVAPYRTQKAFEEMGITEIRIPPNALMDPRDKIDI